MTEYPEPRELCGVYYRVKRDGKWKSICFSDLTPAEMDTLLAEMSYEHARGLAEAEFKAAADLVDFLRENVTDGGIENLREIAKLIAQILHHTGDATGTTCRDPSEDQ